MKTNQAREALRIALNHNGWKEDRFGHFHKEFREEKQRVKFQANSVRIEKDCSFGWMKLTGEFFGHMKIEMGAIRVGNRTFTLPTGEAK